MSYAAAITQLETDALQILTKADGGESLASENIGKENEQLTIQGSALHAKILFNETESRQLDLGNVQSRREKGFMQIRLFMERYSGKGNIYTKADAITKYFRGKIGMNYTYRIRSQPYILNVPPDKGSFIKDVMVPFEVESFS